MTDKKINVAVIGAGIGRSHIEEGVMNNPADFALHTLCDINLELATSVAAAFPGCRVATDMQKVFEDPEVDLVDICLPPHLHFPAMMAALAAGKHVICEKPFVNSVSEVRQVMAKAEAVGRMVYPVFQYRYGTGYRQMHELQKRGLTGKPYVLTLETHWQRGADYYATPWRGRWSGERGGAIVSHATHIHNLATHLMGDVVSVAAMLDTKVNPIETEDCAAIAMRTGQGALVTSSICLGNAGNMSRMRACFEKLTAESDLHPYKIGAETWTFTAANPADQAEIDAVIAEIRDFPLRFDGFFADIAADLNGGTPVYLPTLAEAAHSMELITAIYQSHRTGQFEALPLAAGHPLMESWLPATEDAA